MKTGFKDPIGQQKGQDKKMRSPWNYDAPPYDERSSCFVSTGTDYGQGHRQPVGTHEHKSTDTIPFGRVKTLDLYPSKEKDLKINEV